MGVAWSSPPFVSQTAITCDKMPLYEAKIDAAINGLYRDIVVDSKPILSSWYARLTELFFDLHVDGVTENHPPAVVEYIDNFARIVSLNSDEVSGSEEIEALLAKGSCLRPEVDEYFEQRRQYIVENNITSTFTYWWDVAGTPKENLVAEAIHNIVAWGQLVNILFLVIRAKIQGYSTIENLLQGRVQTAVD